LQKIFCALPSGFGTDHAVSDDGNLDEKGLSISGLSLIDSQGLPQSNSLIEVEELPDPNRLKLFN
jgi:hypothetical protein